MLKNFKNKIIKGVLNIKKDVFLFLFSKILATILSSISTILIARYFGKYDLGILKTVMTYSNLVFIFINFGLNDYFLIKFSQSKKFSLLRIIIGYAIVLYIIIFPISMFIYAWFFKEGIILFLISYLGAFIGIFSSLVTVIFQSYNKFTIISFITLVNSSILLATVLYFVSVFNGNLSEYFFILLLISSINFFLELSIFLRTFRKKIIYFIPSLSLKNIRVLKLSLPFFLSGLMSYIYMSSDILILSIMKTPQEVARYTIPLTFINAAYLIPSVLYNYFIPKLSNLYIRDKKLYKKSLKQFFWINSILSFPIFGILFFLSRDLLKTVFTEKYIDSYLILQVLAVVFIFHSFCFIFGAVLSSVSKQKIRTIIQIIAAVTNIFLNFIFIPVYGAEGAALTTLLTEIIIFSLYLFFSRKYINL